MSHALATSGGMQVGDVLSPPVGQHAVNTAPRSTATTRMPVRPRQKPGLSKDQKAAVIVRLLAIDADSLAINGLENTTMTRLVHAMAGLKFVDEQTILEVIQEFLHDINSIHLYFRPGVASAVAALEKYLNPEIKKQLAAKPAVNGSVDPWIEIISLPVDVLASILVKETPQITAIALARLPATVAAEILSGLPTDFGHAVALAAIKTDYVQDSTLAHIGTAISQAAKGLNRTGALDGTPVDRLGAILNFAPGAAREDMLKTLEKSDPDLAEQVRRVMFTFADIPDRVEIKDVPKLVRAADNNTMVTALAGALISQKEAADFILTNLSKRLADQLSEEVRELGDVKPKDADTAMNAVVQGVRELEKSGELTLISPEE